MIWKIVRSEIILNRRVMLFNLALAVAMAAAYALLLDGAGAVVASASIAVPAQAALLVRSSKFHADATECALPVSRNQLVAGKLLTVALLMAVCALLVLSTALLVPHPGFTNAELLRPDRLATLLLLVTLVSSALVPLILRFGFLGVLLLVLALNVALVILLVLTAAGVIGDALRFMFRDLPAAVAAFRTAAGFPRFHLGCLAAAAVLCFGSLELSQLIYRRKEL